MTHTQEQIDAVAKTIAYSLARPNKPPTQDEHWGHLGPKTKKLYTLSAIAALDAMPAKEATVQDIERVLDAANDHISEVYGISALGHKMDRGRIIRALSEGK